VVAPKAVGANVTPTAQVVPTSSVAPVQGEAALSATEKGAALDTFYLTDRMGKKIEDEETLAALIAEVRKRIGQ